MKSGYIAVLVRKKPPDNERLFNILHQMAPVITNRLLADAEFLEDGLEEVGGGDGAGDGGEVVDGFAEVLGDEVAGDVGVDAGDYSLKGGCGMGEGFVVAGIGDYKVCFLCGFRSGMAP